LRILKGRVPWVRSSIIQAPFTIVQTKKNRVTRLSMCGQVFVSKAFFKGLPERLALQVCVM
jgi:hypothetical protein